MSNRVIKAMLDQGRKTASQSAAWALIARDTVSGFLTTAHHALMILGIGAIAALACLFVRPDFTDHLKALSPFTRPEASQEPEVADSELANLMDVPAKPLIQGAMPDKSALTGANVMPADIDGKKFTLNREQSAVAGWISRRYRVARDATQMLVRAAYKTADELQLDPLLILAVAAIESGFNPYAESAVGAQGLMQVMSKIHHDKFRQLGGVNAALNPVANIKVGALILKDYVKRGGSVEAGLKLYVGAAAFETDSGYGARVLSEYRRMKDVAAGKNVPVFTTTASKDEPKAVKSDNAAPPKTADDDKAAALAPQERADTAKEQPVAL